MPLTRDRAHPLVRGALALPGAFVVTVAVAVALGAVAEALGVRPLTDPLQSRLAVAGFLVVAAWVGRGLSRTFGPAAGPGRWGWLVVLPAAVLVVYAAVVRLLLSPGERAEWFLGGDHVRHLLFVAEVRAAGNLDYDVQPYPRAWHTLLAATWSSTGARSDAAGLGSLVDLMSTATWCLPALLSLATGGLAVALARRAGQSDTAASLAGLGAAALVLWSPFLANYQALGFENSLVGAIALAVVAREVVAGTGRASPFLALAAIVVCANTWQLLLPAFGVAFLHLAWQPVRTGGWRYVGALVGTCTAAAAVAMPALLAVFTVIGVQHATDSGVEAPLPAGLLLAGVASSTALLLLHRGPPLLVAWLVTVLPGLTAVAVAVRVGIGITEYYPSKLLWHSAALGLAPLAVVVVLGCRRIVESVPPSVGRALRPVGLTAAALAVAAAFASPAGAFLGAWSTVRGPLVIDAITSPRAETAQVVWLGTIGDDTIGRILLDYYRAGETPVRTPQPPLDVVEECQLLQAVDRPSVLSTEPFERVRERYGCAADLAVVPVDS